MSSAVRGAARKLDARAAPRISGSRSPKWDVTAAAGFMSAPTKITAALPFGAGDRDPKEILTAPLIPNAYPMFGFKDFRPTDAASLADADISGGLPRSSISRRDCRTYSVG